MTFPRFPSHKTSLCVVSPWIHVILKTSSTFKKNTYYIYFKRIRKPTSFGGRGTLKSTLQCIFSQMNLAIVLGEMEYWWLMPCSLSLVVHLWFGRSTRATCAFCACSGRMYNAINSGNEFVPSAFWNGNTYVMVMVEMTAFGKGLFWLSCQLGAVGVGKWGWAGERG